MTNVIMETELIFAQIEAQTEVEEAKLHLQRCECKLQIQQQKLKKMQMNRIQSRGESQAEGSFKLKIDMCFGSQTKVCILCGEGITMGEVRFNLHKCKHAYCKMCFIKTIINKGTNLHGDIYCSICNIY